ncbi:MAG TPA: Vms1/Ankzf1 family peptidyl-tRNA hydrolase [Nocardioidaceae bacterium]
MTVLDQRINHSVLDAVLRPVEPAAAVYLGAAPDVHNEYQLSWETRWRPLAAALREQGADEATVLALEQAVQTPASSRAARGSGHVVGFARNGEAIATVTTPGLAGPDLARFGGPAHVLPLLHWEQEHPPYVLVVIDRTGADLETCIGLGNPPQHATVEGPDDEVERNAPGGWEGLTQGRYQRRAEDSWAHNAGAVAEAVAAALKRVEAKILVVAGDVRAEQYLMEKLPAWVHKDVTIQHISGSRADDGSQNARATAVAKAVQEAVALQSTALWERFTEERAPHRLGVEGPERTLAALAEGRVHLLLVSAGTDLDDEAWYGAAPTEVHVAGDSGPTWADPRSGALADVAIRASVLTGAEVRVIPPDAGFGPERGVGGICRYR